MFGLRNLPCLSTAMPAMFDATTDNGASSRLVFSGDDWRRTGASIELGRFDLYWHAAPEQ